MPQADSSNESYETSDIEHNKVRTSKYNFFEMKSTSRAAHRTVYGIRPYRHGAVWFQNSRTRNRTVEFLRLDGYGAAVLMVMTVKTVYRQ